MTFSNLEKQPITRLSQKAGKMDRDPGSSSPAPYGQSFVGLHPNPAVTGTHRRARPETSHQKAVSRNRRMRVESILHKKLKEEQSRVNKEKKASKQTPLYRALLRIMDLPDDYETEDEGSWGPGGLVPNPGEKEDFGGEALYYKKVIDRAMRRLGRGKGSGPWGGTKLKHLGGNIQKQLGDQEHDSNEAIDSETTQRANGRTISHPPVPEPDESTPKHDQAKGSTEILDDLDLDLLGEGREGEEDSNSDSGSDDS